jgi:hypothetical protein
LGFISGAVRQTGQLALCLLERPASLNVAAIAPLTHLLAMIGTTAV